MSTQPNFAELDFSTEPIPGLDEALENYGKPRPRPHGRVNVILTDYNPEWVYIGVSKNNRPYALANGMDFVVVGGEWDGQQLENLSGINLFGIVTQTGSQVTCEQDFLELLEEIKNTGEVIQLGLEWEGSSSTLYKQKLMELTGTDDYESAKDAADKVQKREANEAATILKSVKQFPTNPDGSPSPVADVNGEQIYAETYVRFVPREAEELS